MMWNRKTTRTGFTLVELLVVLAILVMLVSFALPKFLNTSQKAKMNSAQIQIGAFKGELERFALDTGSYPMTEQGLRALVDPPAAVDATGAAMPVDPMAGATMPTDPMAVGGATPVAATGNTTGWNGPYLDNIPKDPWGNDYMYQYPPTRNRNIPDIWSLGPDKTDGTEDDVCNWDKAAVAAGGMGQPMPTDPSMPGGAMPPAPAMPAAPAPAPAM